MSIVFRTINSYRKHKNHIPTTKKNRQKQKKNDKNSTYILLYKKKSVTLQQFGTNQSINPQKRKIMTTVKYNSREEMVKAIKRAIEKKKNWIENAQNNYAQNQATLGRPIIL